jgi:hypothetical protein
VALLLYAGADYHIPNNDKLLPRQEVSGLGREEGKGGVGKGGKMRRGGGRREKE